MKQRSVYPRRESVAERHGSKWVAGYPGRVWLLRRHEHRESQFDELLVSVDDP